MATIIQDKHRGYADRHQRWTRLERADVFAQYGALHAQEEPLRALAEHLRTPPFGPGGVLSHLTLAE